MGVVAILIGAAQCAHHRGTHCVFGHDAAAEYDVGWCVVGGSNVDRIAPFALRPGCAVADLETKGGVGVSVCVGGRDELQVVNVADCDLLILSYIFARVIAIVVVGIDIQRASTLQCRDLDLANRVSVRIGEGEVAGRKNVGRVLGR